MDCSLADTSIGPFVDQVRQWAASRPDIVGLAVVGSYARHQARPDSDLDLILVAAQPERYVDEPGWVATFGTVRSCTVEDWGLVTSLRVYYQDRPEVEYGLTSLAWVQLPLDEGTAQVIADGMLILLDRGGGLGRALEHVVGGRHAAGGQDNEGMRGAKHG